MPVDYSALTPLCSLADAKTRLGITGSDQDDILNSLIAAATDAIRDHVGYELASKSRTEGYSGNNLAVIHPLHQPITAISSLSVNGTSISQATSTTMAGWMFDDTAIRLRGYVFPRGVQNVSITYTAGYATIPKIVAEAALTHVHGLFNAQSVDPNLSSESVPGVYSAAYRQEGAGSLSPAVKSMLQRFVKVTW
jgi:hypothetical protein